MIGMATAYKVTAPLVIVKDEAGSYHHLYDGALLPQDADQDHVDQLLDMEMVEKVTAADAPAKKAAAAK